MNITTKHFYVFSAFHSLLIGLLPFFLPVLLWQKGESLTLIFLFISVTALGFLISLWGWDRLRARQQWRTLIAISFVVEILLVAGLCLDASLWIDSSWNASWWISALLNGAYNCFYWSTQRAMFQQVSGAGNTGKTFGNFQILVVVLLKMGILAGGYWLARDEQLFILLSTVFMSGIALWYLLSQAPQLTHASTQASLQPLTQPLTTDQPREPALTIKDIAQFKDNQGSKTAFWLDGPFLYLESFCWVLSLYFISQQNFLNLGVLVVSLTLLLSVVFYFIKNRIDNIEPQKVYVLAVALYALAWWLRGEVAEVGTNAEVANSVYVLIVLIGFFTTFFRLAFNKRFFDMAKQSRPYRYLICKSYYSQLSIALFFSLLAFVFFMAEPGADAGAEALASLYLWVSPLALLYGLYALKGHSKKAILGPKTNSFFTKYIPKTRGLLSPRALGKR